MTLALEETPALLISGQESDYALIEHGLTLVAWARTNGSPGGAGLGRDVRRGLAALRDAARRHGPIRMRLHIEAGHIVASVLANGEA